MTTNHPSRHVHLLGLLGLGSGLCAVCLTACGQEFDDCEVAAGCVPPGGNAGAAGAPPRPRDGAGAGNPASGDPEEPGSGGAPAKPKPGSGGMAGAPAEPAIPDCSSDADCADGSFCNGDERCHAGACEAGEPACSNDDSDHCRVTCDEATQQCIVAALDADHDGFGTTECAGAPGTDCRDSDPTVHPAALETCDGIDNDCNGRVDTADGLLLAGTTNAIAEAVDADIDWSPDNQAFGILYDWQPADPDSGGMVYGILTPSGAIEQKWLQEQGPDVTYYAPRISWGQGSLVLNGITENLLGEYSLFARMSPNGELLASGFEAHRPAFDLVYRGNQEWLRPLMTSAGLQIDIITRDLEALATVESGSVDAEAGYARIAVQGKQTASVWQTAGSRQIRWVRWTEGLTPLEVEELASNGVAPAIVDVAEGYLIAWATADGLRLLLKDAEDGATRCGPLTIEFGDGKLSDGDGVSLARDDQFVWLLASEATRVELLRIDHDCELVDRVSVSEDSQAATDPKVAVGGGRVALTWNDSDKPGSELEVQARIRQFGERLCE